MGGKATYVQKSVMLPEENFGELEQLQELIEKQTGFKVTKIQIVSGLIRNSIMEYLHDEAMANDPRYRLQQQRKAEINRSFQDKEWQKRVLQAQEYYARRDSTRKSPKTSLEGSSEKKSGPEEI